MKTLSREPLVRERSDCYTFDETFLDNLCSEANDENDPEHPREIYSLGYNHYNSFVSQVPLRSESSTSMYQGVSNGNIFNSLTLLQDSLGPPDASSLEFPLNLFSSSGIYELPTSTPGLGIFHVPESEWPLRDAHGSSDLFGECSAPSAPQDSSPPPVVSPTPTQSCGSISKQEEMSLAAVSPSSAPKPKVSKRKRQKGKKTEISRKRSRKSTNQASSNQVSVEDQVIVKPTEDDVLLGRGGKSNNHPGNQRYLRAKESIQARYLRALKEEKTGISQELVQMVHEWGGRFLKCSNKANDEWYEVENIVARKKCSQSLREFNTPTVRAERRQRYGK